MYILEVSKVDVVRDELQARELSRTKGLFEIAVRCSAWFGRFLKFLIASVGALLLYPLRPGQGRHRS